MRHYADHLVAVKPSRCVLLRRYSRGAGKRRAQGCSVRHITFRTGCPDTGNSYGLCACPEPDGSYSVRPVGFLDFDAPDPQRRDSSFLQQDNYGVARCHRRQRKESPNA